MFYTLFAFAVVYVMLSESEGPGTASYHIWTFFKSLLSRWLRGKLPVYRDIYHLLSPISGFRVGISAARAWPPLTSYKYFDRLRSAAQCPHHPFLDSFEGNLPAASGLLPISEPVLQVYNLQISASV